MVREPAQLRREAVLLRDDSMGVSTEDNPRKIQSRTQNGGFDCSFNPEWLEQLQLNDQGEPTVHSVSLGLKPVIVQNPAIIVQPYSVIEDSNEKESNSLW